MMYFSIFVSRLGITELKFTQWDANMDVFLYYEMLTI